MRIFDYVSSVLMLVWFVAFVVTLHRYRKSTENYERYVKLIERQRAEAMSLAQSRAVTLGAIRVALTDCIESPDVNLNGKPRELVGQCLSVLGWRLRRATSTSPGNIGL